MGLKALKAEMQVTMQINIDKKTGSLLAIIVLLVGALIYVVGMRNTDEMPGMHQHMQSSSNSKYALIFHKRSIGLRYRTMWPEVGEH